MYNSPTEVAKIPDFNMVSMSDNMIMWTREAY